MLLGRGTAGRSRLAHLDPGQVALRRAARVTITACLAFYSLRYGLGDPTSAVYALFTAIALGALSEVQGAPATRTRTYLTTLLIGALLITAGTLAAVDTAVAVLGMLVVGFTVAYAGVGGPRFLGVANGLQLLYILPCFPPFAPDTLDQRLLGLLVGGALITATDRLLWPAPGPPPPGERLAVTADRIAAYAGALRSVLDDPAALGGEELAARREALDAAARLRLADIPLPERPLGPGAQDRALLAAGVATRVTAGRIAALADLLRDRQPHPRTADLLGATAGMFTELAGRIRAGRPEPIATTELDAALAGYVIERGRNLAGHVRPAADLRAGLAAVAVAEETRIAALAAGGFLGAPPPEPADTPPALWFLHASRTELVRRRLRAHLTPRSVYLQNAVRLALGLAAARTIAGVLDLSHGFWVLLATLSLMRTSASAGRAVLLRAFGGTVLGAVVAAALLTAIGTDTDVYAWALPPVMVLAFAAGPLFGVAAGQAGFTVVVAMVFAQLAPAGWQLAEVRLTDVVIGGLVGAVIGAAVWPRGGGGEVRQVAAAGLRAGAATVPATIDGLVGEAPVAPPDLHRLTALFDHAYVQFRTEPTGPSSPDWLAVLSVLHRIENYAEVLSARHPAAPGGPLPGRTELRDAAREVADEYTAAADAIAAGQPPRADTIARLHSRLERVAPPDLSDEETALRLVDGWGWLHSLTDDLDQVRRAVDQSTEHDRG